MSASILKTIPAIDSQDGAGVKLKRSLGRNPATRVDPFLMLDAFSSANPDDYMAGFPPHPHRGFETVTYMLNGHMLHRDHMGNEGDLRAGGVQWMTAGRGVIHEERPQRTDGLMQGFQLWINLPAKDKMQPAAYQNIEPETVPEYTFAEDTQVKVIAGTLDADGQTIQGPIQSGYTDVTYFDITLGAGKSLTLPLKQNHNSFIYLFDGEGLIGDTSMQINHAHILTKATSVTLTGGEKPARLLFLAGHPIGEPVAQYGPFVMNTMAEVEQAIQDYQHNRLTDG